MKNKILKIRNIGFIVCSVFLLIMIFYSCFSEKDDSKMLDLDNFKIENITEEEKKTVTDCYKGFRTKWRASGENSGFDGHKYENEDHDETRFSAKKITGIKTVNATEAENCTVNWIIGSTVSKGNAKIIIVVDSEIILKEFEFGQKINFEYKADGKHEVLVKIICEDAEVNIEVERTLSQT